MHKCSKQAIDVIPKLSFDKNCRPDNWKVWVSLMTQMVKNLVYNAVAPGLIPGLGRSPGEGNGYPLQYPCLENSTY